MAFTAQTAADLQAAVTRINTVALKLDTALNEIRPLAEDLGATAGKSMPTTNFGLTVLRLNRISSDLSLLTGSLRDEKGHLNSNGTLQRLVTSPELFDNLSRMAFSANGAFDLARPALKSLGVFAEKVARDPGTLTRGALSR